MVLGGCRSFLLLVTTNPANYGRNIVIIFREYHAESMARHA